MKRHLLLGAIYCIFYSLYAQTDIDSGNVSGVWTRDNSPYNIHGDIYIQENQSLVIEPGVKVIFHGHYRLRLINANLIAIGNIDDTIVFTAADTNGFANGDWNEGGWNGINFSNASNTGDSSNFSYCRFEYAKVPWNDYGEDQGVVGLFRFPNLNIEYCNFENNRTQERGIVDINLSNVIIGNNLFKHNKALNIISMNQDNPEIYRNRIDSNECDVVIRINAWNHPRIHHNMIIRNTANYIISSHGNCRPRIYQNRFLNNTAQSVIAFEKSKSEFLNNLVANNDAMAFYLFSGDESVILQNTIVYNDGRGIEMDKTSTNNIAGNIFNGNAAYLLYKKGEKEPSFTYNIFDFDTSLWTGDEFTGNFSHNQEGSPHFVTVPGGTGRSFDAEFADFNVAPGSNVLNQGDPDISAEYITPDLYDRERIRYGRIDLGAYETSYPRDTLPAVILRDSVYIADTLFVIGSLMIPDNVNLIISARAVVLFDGPDSIIVNGSLQAIGTEAEPILFTIRDTTGFSDIKTGAGGWRGIILDNSGRDMDDNEPSIFNHCIFQYAKSPGRKGGVFNLRYVDNFILRNSEFRYNYAVEEGLAISSLESDFNIENCSFHHHVGTSGNSRGAVSLTNSNHLIDQCTFFANQANDGAGISVTDCELTLRNSHFFINKSVNWGQAPALSSKGSDVYMSNVLINNNRTEDSGVMEFQSSRARIYNSTIVNNRMDGVESAGISIDRSEVTIYNSIFYGNHSDHDSSSIIMLEDNSDPDLYNTLIQGGLKGIKTWSGFSYTGNFINCINRFPHFVSPSPQSGVVDSILSGDWQLLDISPCINAGTPDTTGMNLPLYDLAGNKRIMQERIDLGAYEKSGEPPRVDAQPVGGNYCTGDSIVISVSYSESDTAILQWQKDGTDIPGAGSRSLLIHPANPDHTGNYSCRVSNSFGYVHSLPVFINIKDPPKIQIQPEDEWVESNTPQSLEILVEGSQPFDIQWTLDGKDLEVSVPIYNFTPSDSSDEGRYTCIVSNVCGTVRTEPINIFLAPQICMVTVSTTTGNNLIVWEKKTKAPVTAYNIYRESKAAGIYDRLATIPSEDLSIFEDSVADPTAQAYIYKITAIDTAGMETDADLCKQHKTIHLLVSTNPEFNTAQLEWDRYYGFDYLTYIIYRSNTGTDLQEIHSLSSNFYSWSESEPQTEKMYYRIAVEKPDACTPEGRTGKAGTGPYKHSLSNMDDNKLKTGIESAYDARLLNICPNPMKEKTSISFSNPGNRPYELIITDLAGKTVGKYENITTGIFTLDRIGLVKGYYLIELRGENSFLGKLIVE